MNEVSRTRHTRKGSKIVFETFQQVGTREVYVTDSVTREFRLETIPQVINGFDVLLRLPAGGAKFVFRELWDTPEQVRARIEDLLNEGY